MYGKSEDRDDYQHTPMPLAAMARDLPDGYYIPAHSHRRAQLIYGAEGAITVTTSAGSWVVPPQRAVWIPAGVTHAMRTSGAVPMRTVYVETDARHRLPSSCTVVAVSPLLRELLVAASEIPVDYVPGSRDDHVMTLLLEEFQPLTAMPLQLPFPQDDALLAVCQRFSAEPYLDWDTARWASWIHLSERTFARRFRAELGCTFGRWRQQARLLAAIEMLARGESIAQVSSKLTYESPSAFSAMFRRCLGTSPTRYFAAPPRTHLDE